MISKWMTPALVAVALALGGCGDDDDGATGPVDGGRAVDAALDAGPALDLATDAGPGQDLATDAGAQADARAEADLLPPGPDATSDAGPGPDDLATDGGGADGGPSDAAVDGGGQPDLGSPDVGLPGELPFDFVRPAAGEPLTPEEITEFTRAITGFWKDVEYFRWVRLHSHGMDPSNPQGTPDYALWWQDTAAIKAGDTVTFQHRGRADNLTLRTCKVLNNLIAGYLLTGDEDMRWTAVQYCKGLAALSMAMEFGPDDPVRYLQARAVFSLDHSYESVGGRRVAIDYGPMRREDESWNAANIHNPDNPHWGDIWFVNQRSKDDVPHMFRSVPMLRRAVRESPDPELREAARLALEYLGGFARDVVDQGYLIRTKFADGEAVVPLMAGGSVKDLASFVTYDAIAPNAECTAKLGCGLVGYGETRDNDCADGSGGVYELLAASGHYFNYAIFRYFHIAATANAIMEGQEEAALALMVGLAERADGILHDEDLPHRDAPEWDSDAAAFLLAAGAAGLPLTHEEARLVQRQYLHTAEHYRAFPYWDPWDESVPDGEFGYKPNRGTAVRPTEISYLLEYCYSPLRNPDSAPLVDCAVVADRERWGR